jgi:FkbM family methyltransferase
MSVFLDKPDDLEQKNQAAEQFWSEFCSDSARPKYVLGNNVYTRSILKHCRPDGIVDDFSKETHFGSIPIVRSADISKDSMVLAASGGRPLSVRRMLNMLEIEQMDYFSIQRATGDILADIVFNEGFNELFDANRSKFETIYSLLKDELSRELIARLVRFRRFLDLDGLEGFTDRQKEQYFEDFLNLQNSGEVFVDVGCFDGFTTLEFIKRCPDYSSVHVFEPDAYNYETCKRRLADHQRLHLWNVGAGSERKSVSFAAAGSASGISEDGELTIEVDRIDDVLTDVPTFIKIDIEGSELEALRGAERTIALHGPRLAVSVYHSSSDFWKIPELVLSLNPNYDVYLRHYTECVYETVMFFVPKKP